MTGNTGDTGDMAEGTCPGTVLIPPLDLLGLSLLVFKIRVLLSVPARRIQGVLYKLNVAGAAYSRIRVSHVTFYFLSYLNPRVQTLIQCINAESPKSI